MVAALHFDFKEFWNSGENPYRRLLAGNQNDVFFHRKALNFFSLGIQNSLLDAFTNAVLFSGRVQSQRALYFLRFGAGRRLNMVWYAYRNVLHLANVERKLPLSNDESLELARDLNVIYVNLRGVLDNLCSALLAEFAPEKKPAPMQIDLFKDVIVGDVRFKSLHAVLAQHGDWYADLMTRRNPSAHRIPLYIPSQIVLKSEADEYQAMEKESLRHAREHQFVEADKALERLQKIGTFEPIFMHDPNEDPIRIYPTVPDDVGHVIVLLKAVTDYWNSVPSFSAP